MTRLTLTNPTFGQCTTGETLSAIQYATMMLLIMVVKGKHLTHLTASVHNMMVIPSTVSSTAEGPMDYIRDRMRYQMAQFGVVCTSVVRACEGLEEFDLEWLRRTASGEEVRRGSVLLNARRS